MPESQSHKKHSAPPTAAGPADPAPPAPPYLSLCCVSSLAAQPLLLVHERLEVLEVPLHAHQLLLQLLHARALGPELPLQLAQTLGQLGQPIVAEAAKGKTQIVDPTPCARLALGHSLNDYYKR